MPYIGNTPALDYISYAVQNFTVTAGTTVYTLDYSVSNENDIRLVINNVIQRPGASYAYSATGTTLTLTSATQSGDTMYAVFIGRAVQTVVPPANINIQLADGTAAAPSLNFANDTNTGIFRPTTDSIGFTEGGAEAMRINADQQIVAAAGTASLPVITTTGDLNTGMFFPTADTIAFTEGGAEAMRIDSSGRVGIGVTSINQRLQLPENTNVGFNGGTNNAKIGGIIFGTDSNFSRYGMIDSFRTSDAANIDLRFYTMAGDVGGIQERMRIANDGTLLIAKTGENYTVVGSYLKQNGEIVATRSAGNPLALNRKTSDGTLVLFFQDDVEEGNISVSGATVSYNGFTGSHWSRFIDGSKPDVLRGTVLESLDQMVDWYAVEFEVSTTENDVVKTHKEHKSYTLKANEQVGDVITYDWNTGKKDEDDNDIIEQVQATIVKETDVKHVMSKISDTVEAKNVYGVFSAWDNDDLINNDFYVASVGSFVVRIKAGETVNKGDLLQSNGDGTAKVQADDIVRASSFAKVLSNTKIQTYEDGSFIVPCSLMC